MVQVWDSVAGRLVDSVVVRSPLPGPILPVVQRLAVLLFLWQRVIVGWLVPRYRGRKLAMAGAVGGVLLLVGTGVQADAYVRHDNGFCSGCPIFVPRGRLFLHPDRGTYLLVERPTSWLVEQGRVRGQGDRPPDDQPPGGRTEVSVSPSDTFPHARHNRLACLTCHDLRSKERLMFEVPRGCQTCHHQRPARSDCATCHQPEELAEPRPVSVRVVVPQHPPRLRDVAFEHGRHERLECTGCHTMPVSLAPSDSVRTCAACHANHHAEGRACASCHRTDAIIAPHEQPVQVHQACAACHTPATVARLVPVRSFCLTCHSDDVDHFTPKECTACHFQSTPAELQPRLQRTGGRS
jgi:hypothetical protein